MATTELVGWRKATKQEQKDHGAEVVFTREDEDGTQHTIYACVCYESWEQWGAIRSVLSDNMPDVEAWRRKQDEVLTNEEES